MVCVLVVDDDASIRRAYAAVLREEGHLVSQARNGTEALDLMRMHLYPMVVVTDVMMPGLDGVDLLEGVMDVPDMRHDFTFVVVSAANMPQSPRAAAIFERARVEPLRKPVDIDTLLDAVKAAAERLPRVRHQSSAFRDRARSTRPTIETEPERAAED